MTLFFAPHLGLPAVRFLGNIAVVLVMLLELGQAVLHPLLQLGMFRFAVEVGQFVRVGLQIIQFPLVSELVSPVAS